MCSKSVPVIDIDKLEAPETLLGIDEACREWGFFQVINHGIEYSVVRGLHEAMRAFFAQPQAARRRVLRSKDNPWGYYDRELTKNTLDWKEVYDYGPADGKAIYPRWPEALPAFQSALEVYSAANERLAYRLLDAIARNLGSAPALLREGFTAAHTSFLRLNHYPACPSPATPAGLEKAASGHLGVNYHTDAGALTLLLQDQQPGLEVLHRGKWYLVEPRADALVVNIGDIVQVWSNDRYHAAMHRVVLNTEKERFSAPYFFNPDYTSHYAPLPSMTSEQNPARYRPINWGEFRKARADGDYADYGDEIQIDHFRIQ
jgi:isopenicillin N synthase-like dioxygenase